MSRTMPAIIAERLRLEPRPDQLALGGGEIGLLGAALDGVLGLDDRHMRAGGFGQVGLEGIRCGHGSRPHDGFADARIDQRQRDVGEEVHRHDGRGQQEDDGTRQLLVVRARQRFEQQRAGLGQRQDQRRRSAVR